MKQIQINGLNEKQYTNKYLKLCNQYNTVDQTQVTMSWSNGLYYGYLLVK